MSVSLSIAKYNRETEGDISNEGNSRAGRLCISSNLNSRNRDNSTDRDRERERESQGIPELLNSRSSSISGESKYDKKVCS